MAAKIKIGTRGSALALFQARLFADLLQRADAAVEAEIVEIKTSGDWKPSQGEQRLSEAQGGKGQFAREIEHALTSGVIDCGVHSMKDMPSFLPDGLVIDHILPREDPRDAFLCNQGGVLDDLPHGAVVGTASMRRQSFLLARRPDLKIVPFRGNVPTRIAKLRDGQVDATLLAVAGLKRLDLLHESAAILQPEIMLPAAGQGAIGIEIRAGDTHLHGVLDAVHCRESGLCVFAERAALQILDGSCHTPIGAYATIAGDVLSLRVAVGALDGQPVFSDSEESAVRSRAEAEALGAALGERLKARLPVGFLE